MNRSPNNEHIHAKVEMDEAVAHSGHLFPRHSGILNPNGLWNKFGSFTDDFKLTDDSTDGFVISLKLSKRHSGYKSLDAINGSQNVFKIQSSVSHITTAS